jgi:SAM-dependent methyltransferase
MPRENLEVYTKVNKKHWNVWAKRDWPYKKERLKQIRNGGPFIEEVEPKLAPYLKNIQGKKVLVPQFGDGLVMLVCAKKGATVTGVDLSSAQIQLAKEASAYCGVHVNLLEGDIQKLPRDVPNDYFDIAVTECGIFGWIGNLDAWMSNVYRVLKNGGKLIVSDFHPLSVIAEEKKGKVTFKRSYFDQGPKIVRPKKDVPPAVEFVWKLSDVINAAICAGFRIECVEEYYVKQARRRKAPFLPTDFLLAATKS